MIRSLRSLIRQRKAAFCFASDAGTGVFVSGAARRGAARAAQVLAPKFPLRYAAGRVLSGAKMYPVTSNK